MAPLPRKCSCPWPPSCPQGSLRRRAGRRSSRRHRCGGTCGPKEHGRPRPPACGADREVPEEGEAGRRSPGFDVRVAHGFHGTCRVLSTRLAPAWVDALFASDGLEGAEDQGRPRCVARRSGSCGARCHGSARRRDLLSLPWPSTRPCPRPGSPGSWPTLARVLNVDAYAVLDVDATAQQARLSLPTLGEQFQIDVGRT